jgi:hypothetical protein
LVLAPTGVGAGKVRGMRRILDPELAQWPIEEDDRRRIRDRRISMFGRTDWSGYPRGFPAFGRTGFLIFLTVIQPIACVLVIVGLLLAGTPNSAFAFGMTFIAQALILVIILRGRRRSVLRAAAAELGHPVCLICGFYNQGHRQQLPCSECGSEMPDLPDEFFPPVEADERVAEMKAQRRRSPPLRFGNG